MTDIGIPDGSADRRHEPRRPIDVPAILFVRAADGGPAVQGPVEARVLDAASGGLGLRTKGEVDARSPVLVAVLGADGRYRCAGLEILQVDADADGRRLGCKFGGALDALTAPSGLSPQFDPVGKCFRFAIPEAVLQAWADAGVLRSEVEDRVQVCPSCEALPTFRSGCGACGSFRIRADRLLHHFACAHVGFLSEFDVDGRVVCPKCLMKDLVVGADFEHLTGAVRCADCGWTGSEPERVGHCLGCGLRFPAEQAAEIVLRRYHADRLDPLDLQPAS